MSDSSLFHTLVGIREVNDREFRMVALMDIPKGLPDLIFLSLDSIICCSYPVVIAPTASHIPFICSYCYKRFTKLSRCSKCRIVRYCSKECQKADWCVSRWRIEA